jgi:hypothetical protein
MAEPFDSVARQAYEKILSGRVTNTRLRDYFNTCFQNSIDHYGVYQCWACIDCLRNGQATQGWGEPPSNCPRCHSSTVYEIATFQARSPIVGNAFATAFSYLMQTLYRLPLTPTPGNTRTHDFEVTGDIALETKGSPSRVINPDGTFTNLGRPGMERSDTRKKAFENARTYRQRNPSGLFFVVSNAIPSDLVGYRNRDVTAVFDVNKVDRLEAMMSEIQSRVDLKALRRQRGWANT